MFLHLGIGWWPSLRAHFHSNAWILRKMKDEMFWWAFFFFLHRKWSLRKVFPHQCESFLPFFFRCCKSSHRADKCAIYVVLFKALWSGARPWPWYLAWMSRCGSHRGDCQLLCTETFWEQRHFTLQKGKKTSHSPLPLLQRFLFYTTKRWHKIWWISSFFFFYTHLNYYININS